MPGKPSRKRARKRARQEYRRRRRWQLWADRVLNEFVALQLTGVAQQSMSLKALLQSLDPTQQQWLDETLRAGALEFGYQDWLSTVLDTKPKKEKR